MVSEEAQRIEVLDGDTVSDREDEPSDLFDAVCRLDDLADWIEAEYPDEAAQLRSTSEQLKGYVRISLKSVNDPI